LEGGGALGNGGGRDSFCNCDEKIRGNSTRGGLKSPAWGGGEAFKKTSKALKTPRGMVIKTRKVSKKPSRWPFLFTTGSTDYWGPQEGPRGCQRKMEGSTLVKSEKPGKKGPI